MLDRTLVTLDASERWRDLLPYAQEIAARLQSKVILLRVIEPERWSDEAAEAERYLARFAELFLNQDLDVETDVRSGKPQDEILKAALEHRADMILMATRAPQGLQRMRHGSIAEHVLRVSHLPVLLVRAA